MFSIYKEHKILQKVFFDPAYPSRARVMGWEEMHPRKKTEKCPIWTKIGDGTPLKLKQPKEASTHSKV